MGRLTRWLALLAAPLMLSSCLLQPTKFVSTLDIRTDRSFTFSYVGEVVLPRSEQSPAGGLPPESQDEGEAPLQTDEARYFKIGEQPPAGAQPPAAGAPDSAQEAAEFEQLAKALASEYGYRAVRYVGNRKLAIDYRIGGKLDHAFIFPFHPDGQMFLPFIAIELRGKDRVRVKAPGYAYEDSAAGGMSGVGGMPGPGSRTSELDGTFTLTTNAEIVSQNQEDGAASQPDGSKRIVWKATPTTRDAPMAVLRVATLP